MRNLPVVAFTCLLLVAGNVAGVSAAEAAERRNLRLQWWREAQLRDDDALGPLYRPCRRMEGAGETEGFVGRIGS